MDAIFIKHGFALILFVVVLAACSSITGNPMPTPTETTAIPYTPKATVPADNASSLPDDPRVPPSFRGTADEIAHQYIARFAEGLDIDDFETQIRWFYHGRSIAGYALWPLGFNLHYGEPRRSLDRLVGWEALHPMLVLVYDGDYYQLLDIIPYTEQINGSFYVTLRLFLESLGLAPEAFEPIDNRDDFPAIAALYQRAQTAAAWFELTGFPIARDPYIVVADGWFAIDHDGFSTMAGLDDYLNGIFSHEIVDRLLNTYTRAHLFREVDGILYTWLVEAGRGSNRYAGYERHEIIPISEYAFIYRVHVDIYNHDFTDIAGVEPFDFHLIYTDGLWLFTNFRLVR